MKVDEIKADVRKRDGRCVECGIDWRTYSRKIGSMKIGKFHVHRKIPDGPYSLENCETLCPGCHSNKRRDYEAIRLNADISEYRKKKRLIYLSLCDKGFDGQHADSIARDAAMIILERILSERRPMIHNGGRIEKREINELMALRGWSKTDLASELGITESAVRVWLFRKNRGVKGPAGILMREWLEEARRERKAVTA